MEKHEEDCYIDLVKRFSFDIYRQMHFHKGDLKKVSQWSYENRKKTGERDMYLAQHIHLEGLVLIAKPLVGQRSLHEMFSTDNPYPTSRRYQLKVTSKEIWFFYQTYLGERITLVKITI